MERSFFTAFTVLVASRVGRGRCAAQVQAFGEEGVPAAVHELGVDVHVVVQPAVVNLRTYPR